jgi:hypothetical protein
MDFSHKGERMSTAHNIQDAKMMEDMGGTMPRIYAALDNKHA